MNTPMTIQWVKVVDSSQKQQADQYGPGCFDKGRKLRLDPEDQVLAALSRTVIHAIEPGVHFSF
jgi:hypothetical protein